VENIYLKNLKIKGGKQVTTELVNKIITMFLNTTTIAMYH